MLLKIKNALNYSTPGEDWKLNLIPIAVVVFFTYLARNFQLDDALIYLRYIRNFLDGHGLTYNIDSYFNGLTSSLYTYILIFGTLILGNSQIASIAISSIFMIGMCLAGGRILSKGILEASFTASVIGATSYFYSTYGMETPIFLFLIGLSLYLYKLGSPWFIISLALLLITRSEGIFLAAVISIDYLIRHRRLPDFRYLFAATIITFTPFVFNYFYYGSMLPATGGAKIGQGQSGLWGSGWLFLDLDYFIPAFLKGSELAAGIYACFAVYGFYLELRNRIAVIATIFLTLLAAFYISLNIPNYHWYYAPFVYIILIFASRGFWRTLQLIPKKSKLLPASTAIVFLASAGFGYSLTKSVSIEELSPNAGYVRIGSWLKENTPIDSSVAMVEIGTVGWYSNRTIVDILGLVNEFNAQYIANRQFMHWLLHYQPDYIIRHEPVWEHERTILMLEESKLYEPVLDINVPGLVLLKLAPEVSAKDVLAFTNQRIEANIFLESLASKSTKGPPFEFIQGNELFAHAPSSLPLHIENDVRTLSVSFGIREGAKGLHSELCFEILTQSSDNVLMRECIFPTEDEEDMRRSLELELNANSGEILNFNIYCPVSCDYAWTYWSRVMPMN